MKGMLFYFDSGVREKRLFLALSEPFLNTKENKTMVTGILEDQFNVSSVWVSYIVPIVDLEKAYPLPKLFKNYMD